MNHPWDVRPMQQKGDDNPEGIYLQVGAALTAWEMLESLCAELFDAIVAAQPSNRAAFFAFSAVKSSSARTELIEAAAAKAIPPSDPVHADVAAAIEAFRKFGARRNEIAHGRAYNLGQFGFFLGPNNVMRHKWADNGAAKYQYVADDIAYYARNFEKLCERIEVIKSEIIQRDIKVRKTRETTLRRESDGTRL